ncbi:hypothetical protein HOA55_03605 [archaeon]|jgi:hypothetical protein|nr:hypothetical protein [archaeon]MBT3577340.1 hypothetical protein [archaeon]MBT6820416.1 hypothetical protein [archaeon]MBT6956050.1 hypothetical protein [archaeon]MBT7025230.1 hypothetical protein [archaeon]
MKKKRSIVETVFVNLVSFLVFLIILGLTNVVAITINNPLLTRIVFFLNSCVFLIFVLSVIILISKLFDLISFPFNLPVPLFNAAAGITFVIFLFKIFNLLGDMFGSGFTWVENLNIALTYFWVSIIIIFMGYARLLSEARRARCPPIERIEKKGKEVKWSDVGNEARGILYDILTNIRSLVRPRRKKK